MQTWPKFLQLLQFQFPPPPAVSPTPLPRFPPILRTVQHPGSFRCSAFCLRLPCFRYFPALPRAKFPLTPPPGGSTLCSEQCGKPEYACGPASFQPAVAFIARCRYARPGVSDGRARPLGLSLVQSAILRLQQHQHQHEHQDSSKQQSDGRYSAARSENPQA